jgi:hypothetical protein
MAGTHSADILIQRSSIIEVLHPRLDHFTKQTGLQFYITIGKRFLDFWIVCEKPVNKTKQTISLCETILTWNFLFSFLKNIAYSGPKVSNLNE